MNLSGKMFARLTLNEQTMAEHLRECGDETAFFGKWHLNQHHGGHPEFTANAPRLGTKWNLYEGGIRAPMI